MKFRLAVGLMVCAVMAGASLPRLKVSPDHRFLLQADGKPFFYLGDTAWELFHRLDRKEAAAYLRTRASQRFTVVQAVAISELDGLRVPNANGDLPLVDRDPARPVEAYWKHVDWVIAEASRNGLYVGLLPTWASWVVKDPRKDESIFTAASAQAYGEFLGKRYARAGVIWILGGDRLADGVEEIWRAMAKGIAIGVAGKEDYDAVLMTFHPRGSGTSSTWFHRDAWLDFNMQQTSHGLNELVKSWARIARDYALEPPKPVIDGEPLYEDHPLAFNARENGYSLEPQIRQRAYWDLFAGACGHTYGHHAVWQMYTAARKPVNGPQMYWYEAMQRPAANQMRFVRRLIESRPVLSRVPDQSLVADELLGSNHIAATRGDGYAFIYDAQGRPFTLVLGKISGKRVKCWWYNPRSGDSTEAGEFSNAGTQAFTAPSEGFGSDWVLIVDDASKGFRAP